MNANGATRKELEEREIPPIKGFVKKYKKVERKPRTRPVTGRRSPRSPKPRPLRGRRSLRGR